MIRRPSLTLLTNATATTLCLLTLSVLVLGCNNRSATPEEPAEPAAGEHDDHGHDHDHDHDHAELGPHGGHIAVLDPGHHHVEWVHHDEENIVEVYLGALAGSANRVTMRAEMDGKEPVTYELEPSSELGTGGYQVESPNLLTHIQMSDGAAIRTTLVVETDEGALQALLSGDHDHDH